jgi:hypothetical protein
MTSLLARHRLALLVLGAGLALRVVLAFVVFPGAGYAGDLGQFWQWAQALAANGPGSFYATVSSANYPPLYLYVLWLLGAVGAPDLIKLPPILADIGIAAIVYAVGRRTWGERVGLLAAALFLFLPVSWYDSALWGQVDAAGTLLVLAALVLLLDGWSEAALALAVLAVLVKPQYAIGLGIVIPILIRRHLLRPGSGPSPVLRPSLARLDAALGGLLDDQGPRRLVTSALLAVTAAIVVLLPFDIAVFAPASLADVPVIGHVAGLLGLFGRLGGEFSVLTANAFNPWALVGDPSLAQVLAGSSGSWLPDSLPVLGAVSAVTVGAVMLVGVGLLIAIGLLVRDGLVPIMLGFTILALAFFVLPTRVHERYLFPFFAAAALLAAPGVTRVAGLVVIAVLNTLNLHAVLAGNLVLSAGGRTRGGGGFGGRFGGALGVDGPVGGRGELGGAFGHSSFTSINLPWADVARNDIVVVASALGLTVTLVALLAVWGLIVLRPGWTGFGARRPAPSPS